MNMTELAKKAGFTVTGSRIESPYIGGSDISHRLAEFSALVRAEREWVDATPQEVTALIMEGAAGGGWQGFAQRLSAFLKEKNGV